MLNQGFCSSNASKLIYRVALLITLSVEAHVVSAANRPLFDDHAPLDAVLSVPLTQAYSLKPGGVDPYLEGQFSYKAAGQEINKVPVKIRPRGNYRRANCSLPPLRLNFPKKQVKETLLNGQDKLKLVGPCKPGGIYEDLVGLEQIAYQVFETVSPYALKTRALNLTYIDLDQKIKPRKTTAFVIESMGDLAKRVDLEEINPDKARRSELDLGATALLEVFALFIANNDFSTLIGMPGNKCCHNVRLLASKDSDAKFIPVPYDFDMSGLVNAPYAAPPGTLPIRRVRQRYFNGWCKADEHFRSAINTFKEHKPELMALVENSTLISDKAKERTSDYFEEFYTLVDDPSRYEKEILGRCRGTTIN